MDIRVPGCKLKMVEIKPDKTLFKDLITKKFFWVRNAGFSKTYETAEDAIRNENRIAWEE